MKHAATFLLFIFLLPMAGRGQLHNNPARIFEPLPSTFVTDIDQDSSGFIWISTYEGLCQYDGTRVRVFTHIPGDTNSLPGKAVSEVVYDQIRQCLWVGTDGGLCRFDPETGLAERIAIADSVSWSRRVEALVLDRDGTLWFSLDQHGIGHLLPETGIVNLHPFDIDTGAFIPSSLGSIRDIATDPHYHDNLWIGTSGGLVHFRKSQQTLDVLRFAGTNVQSKLHLNQLRTVYPHANGTLYLGTWSYGLITFEPDLQKTGDREIPPEAYTVHGDQGVMPPIIARDTEHLWVSMVQGICSFDVEDRRLANCYRMASPNDRYFPLVIELADNADRLWASSEQGVYLFDPHSALVQNHRFPPGDESYFYIDGELVEVPEDSSIVATYHPSGGVYRFDRVRHTFSVISPSGDSRAPDDPFVGEGIVRRSDGTIVVVEREGLYMYDPLTRRLTSWDTPLDKLSVLWQCITEDHNANLWLGTAKSGLVRYNPRSGEVTVFDQELQQDNMDWPNPIDQLFVDSRGNVWMSMWSSSAVYDASSQSIVTIPLINGAKYEPSQFAEDAMGNIWFGVENGGIAYVNKESRTFQPEKLYDRSAGLPDTDIRSLAIDHLGKLWVITPSGLLSFDPVSGDIRQLTERDGLIMYDANFNRNPMVLTQLYTLSDGHIAYAPRAGLSIFDPKHLPVNTETPRPYIHSVSVRDTTRYYSTSNNEGGDKFRYGALPLIVHLSALGFTQSEHNAFQYKLTKSDTTWIQAPNGDIVFNTLNPGQHTVYFRVLNSNGSSSPVAHFGIRVLPPWWLSWWFWAAVAALVAGILWAIIAWRQQSRDALRKRENEVQVLMATLESRALRSQMNPHFLFNIFNTIQELILTGDNDMAYLYTSKFSRLLRMILENAGKDAIPLADEKAFLELYLELESLRFDDAFTYSIEVEPGLEHHQIPVFMVQPLVENAIRHGLLPKSGDKDLAVRFDSQDDLLVCTVLDNGVGLSQKTSDNGSGRWHAIGMIRRRLEMTQSGKLTIQNGGSGGVVAKLILPYS